MPQLMPLFWMLSVLMIMFILLMLVDFYFYKNQEDFGLLNLKFMDNYNHIYKW